MSVPVVLWMGDDRVDSEILSLFPDFQRADPVVEDALREAAALLDRQLIWLIPAIAGDSAAAALWWRERLERIPGLAVENPPVPGTGQDSWMREFFEHRVALLPESVWDTFGEEPDRWAQWVLGQLYSPFHNIRAAELRSDPLLLARLHQSHRGGSLPQYGITEGFFTVRGPSGEVFFVIRAEWGAPSLTMATSEDRVDALLALHEEFRDVWGDAEVLRRGTLFYSHHMASQTRREIAWIGVLGGIGILLVFWVFFRSPVPLLLSILTVGVGVVCGLFATMAVFGQIHLVTLLLSLSVVGLALDYSLHFLVARAGAADDTSSEQTVRDLRPALVFAALTTTCAYLLMFTAPFPGLRQLAVCAAAGILGALLTVVLVFPLLPSIRPGNGLHWPALMAWRWMRCLRDRSLVRIGLPLLLLGFAVWGMSRLTVDDDIGNLQNLPGDLVAEEDRIAALTGQSMEQNWILVLGDDAQAVLRRMEELSPELKGLQEQGLVESYRLLSDQLPSLERQRLNLERVDRILPQVKEILRDAGLELPASSAVDGTKTMPVESWVASPLGQGSRLLWLGDVGGKSAAIVPVSGVTDQAVMDQVMSGFAHVHWINRRAEISQLFADQRARLLWLIVASLVVAMGIFTFRFGLIRGIACVLPTVLAMGVAVASIGAVGEPLSLFAMLGLLLVLGVSLDYAFFFANVAVESRLTMLAVGLSALTTILAFGLLLFSGIPAVASLGQIVFVGMASSFLISPWIGFGLSRASGEIT